MYTVKKTYGHNLGLSATFRQWRAESHCRFMHGYAVGISLTFGCNDSNLDLNGWVLNFGGLKEIKGWLEYMFDHKTLVAEDDPMLDFFVALDAGEASGDPTMNGTPLIQLRIVERTGCEGFAKMVHDHVASWLVSHEGTRVKLLEVEVREHAGNCATYQAG